MLRRTSRAKTNVGKWNKNYFKKWNGSKGKQKKKVYGENEPAINTNEKTPRIQDAFGVAGSLVFPHLFNVISSNFL